MYNYKVNPFNVIDTTKMTNADLIDKINTAPAKPQVSSPALAQS